VGTLKYVLALALAMLLAACGGGGDGVQTQAAGLTPAGAALAIDVTQPEPAPQSQDNGCNDFALHDTEGSTITVEYAGFSSGIDSSTTTSRTWSLAVGGLTTFEGHEVRRTVVSSSSMAYGESNSISRVFAVRTGPAETAVYGVEHLTWAADPTQATADKQVYASALVDRKFLLASGESVTVPSVSILPTAAPVGNPPIGDRHTAEKTTTYLGREQVTVPGGTFLTCKFEDTYPVPDHIHRATGPDTFTYWLIAGYGIKVKEASKVFLFHDRSEAVSVIVNGRRL
jgi:hypothetical protein